MIEGEGVRCGAYVRDGGRNYLQIMDGGSGVTRFKPRKEKIKKIF